MSGDEELSIEERYERLREADEAKQGQRDADRLAALDQREETLTAAVRDAQITNAFLTHDGHAWHDRDMALSYLDRSACVGDDGEVDAGLVAKAAQEVARNRPYLVKPFELPRDMPHGPSAALVGSGRRYRGPRVLNDEALFAKYRMDAM